MLEERNKMARKYRYTDFKSGKLLFETTQPNHVSETDVNKMFNEKTGRNYPFERARIDLEIRMVKE